MSQELGYAHHKMREYRRAMDECWIELETATEWEHIKDISHRLSSHGLEYKQWKKRYNELLYPDKI